MQIIKSVIQKLGTKIHLYVKIIILIWNLNNFKADFLIPSYDMSRFRDRGLFYTIVMIYTHSHFSSCQWIQI